MHLSDSNEKSKAWSKVMSKQQLYNYQLPPQNLELLIVMTDEPNNCRIPWLPESPRADDCDSGGGGGGLIQVMSYKSSPNIPSYQDTSHDLVHTSTHTSIHNNMPVDRAYKRAVCMVNANEPSSWPIKSLSLLFSQALTLCYLLPLLCLCG